MKLKKTQLIFCAIILVGLAGCGKVIDWGAQTFDQGKDVYKLFEKGGAWIRSTTIYDQFTTAGMFDALWLSNKVRTIYVTSYSVRRAKSEDFKRAFLRRQLEENNHFITFYVLSPFELPLGEPQSDWQLFLKVDNVIYNPLEIKAIDLDLEYKYMFGKRFTRFKESYIVKFDAKDLQDQFIISPETHVIELYFRSSSKEASLAWRLPGSGHETFLADNSIIDQEIQEEKEARLQPEVTQVNP